MGVKRTKGKMRESGAIVLWSLMICSKVLNGISDGTASKREDIYIVDAVEKRGERMVR